MRYRRLQITGSFLVWIILWLVKATFLSLYRLMFGVSQSFMRAWWIVCGIIFVLFWVPIAGVLTTCGPTQGIFNFRMLSLVHLLAALTPIDRNLLKILALRSNCPDL